MRRLDYQENAVKKLVEKVNDLFGGIIIEKGDSFWYSDQEVYQYDENRLSESGWKILS